MIAREASARPWLAALQQSKVVPSLDGLADHLVKLGSPFRFHAALIRGASARKDQGAVIGQLIQVLDKLESAECPRGRRGPYVDVLQVPTDTVEPRGK